MSITALIVFRSFLSQQVYERLRKPAPPTNPFPIKGVSSRTQKIATILFLLHFNFFWSAEIILCYLNQVPFSSMLSYHEVV